MSEQPREKLKRDEDWIIFGGGFLRGGEQKMPETLSLIPAYKLISIRPIGRPG
ncbi:hypothetical protein [Methylocaldum szegediense]|jgi:hypothetical protein|uniref:hypothetical protein n=1 Tax=Methylocaldum szegediense TaxID=73780 RepID=UPI0012EB6521|nr:hypothetical protein [Methylocaldum szegediense]